MIYDNPEVGRELSISDLPQFLRQVVWAHAAHRFAEWVTGWLIVVHKQLIVLRMHEIGVDLVLKIEGDKLLDDHEHEIKLYEYLGEV